MSISTKDAVALAKAAMSHHYPGVELKFSREALARLVTAIEHPKRLLGHQDAARVEEALRFYGQSLEAADGMTPSRAAIVNLLKAETEIRRLARAVAATSKEQS